MKILLLDIETAPNKVFTWGLWNQNIAINQIEEAGYTLCWAAKWYGKKEIMFASLFKDGAEKMLQTIYDLIDEADVIIHYNGTKFDLPTLNQEFAKIGWKPPSSVLEIDLLKTAKKKFRLPSNKLSFVVEYFGLRKKVAHKGMGLWRGCMRGDATSWAIMEKYNKGDILSLESVYKYLKPWIVGHPNYGLFKEHSFMLCPTCGSKHLQKRGFAYTSTQKYRRYQCKDCGSWSREKYSDVKKENRKNILKGI